MEPLHELVRWSGLPVSQLGAVVSLTILLSMGMLTMAGYLGVGGPPPRDATVLASDSLAHMSL